MAAKTVIRSIKIIDDFFELHTYSIAHITSCCSVGNSVHFWWIVISRFLKGNQASTWNWGISWVGTVREVEIIIMQKIVISMSIICTSLTVRTQPSPWFHVKTWFAQALKSLWKTEQSLKTPWVLNFRLLSLKSTWIFSKTPWKFANVFEFLLEKKRYVAFWQFILHFVFF